MIYGPGHSGMQGKPLAFDPEEIEKLTSDELIADERVTHKIIGFPQVTATVNGNNEIFVTVRVRVKHFIGIPEDKAQECEQTMGYILTLDKMWLTPLGHDTPFLRRCEGMKCFKRSCREKEEELPAPTLDCVHCGRKVELSPDVYEDAQLVCGACDGVNQVSYDELSQDIYFVPCEEENYEACEKGEED